MSNDYHLTFTDYRLTIADYRLTFTDYRKSNVYLLITKESTTFAIQRDYP